MQMIDVSKLIPHPRNAEFFDDITGDKWEDFKKSIVRRGVVEGVVATQDLLIVSGHQRARACIELGIQEIPCRISHYPDADEQTGNPKEDMILEDLISTNILQRGIGNVNPMKMARCIVELERIYGVRQGSSGSSHQDNLNGKTQKDLASQIGISQQQLSDYKKLNILIPELQELIETGELKATTGYKIWAKMSQDEQEKFLGEIGQDNIGGLTQKETQRLLLEKQDLQYDLDELEQKLKDRPIIEKDRVIKQEVAPEDYHQIKNELQLLKHQLEEANKSKSNAKPDRDINKKTISTISNHKDVDIEDFNAKYNFRINDFLTALQECSIVINPFIFMDNHYKKMDKNHKNYLLNEVMKLDVEISQLKNQIINHGGIVNE